MTIAPEEKCTPTLKITPTLTKTLTLSLTGGQFSSGAIVRIPFVHNNDTQRFQLSKDHV